MKRAREEPAAAATGRQVLLDGWASAAAAVQPAADSPPVPLTEDWLRRKTVAELKEMCVCKGTPCTGNKSTLIKYLLDPNRYQKTTADGRRTLSKKQVEKLFREAGAKMDDLNMCLAAGVQHGHVPLTDGKLDLDKELHRGPCHCCGAIISCTIRDALHQPHYGYPDYEDGSKDGCVQDNPCKEECGGSYITGLCCGNPHFDCGKFHNHCLDCPGFGKCIGDYREAHCGDCGKHWFQGLSGFPCDNCERRRGGGRHSELDWLGGFDCSESED